MPLNARSAVFRPGNAGCSTVLVPDLKMTLLGLRGSCTCGPRRGGGIMFQDIMYKTGVVFMSIILNCVLTDYKLPALDENYFIYILNSNRLWYQQVWS